VTWSSFRFGLGAGIGGAVGLALFYWGLSIGTMSIVAPIVACSAIVPFTLALAGGERPSSRWADGRGRETPVPQSRDRRGLPGKS